jgi:sugar lactone lactonase YvrE
LKVRRVAWFILTLALLLVSGIIAQNHAYAFANGEPASLVLGQSNFTTTNASVGATRLSAPEGIAIDSSGNLWVADTANSRVLEFKAPFSIGEPASLVIGEPNFTTIGTQACPGGSGTILPSCLSAPSGVAFDSSGNLWVADGGDSRLLEFKPPFTNDENASLALGQTSLTDGLFSGTPTQSDFGYGSPTGVTFDATGNLWAVDYGYNRVLEFKTPFSTGEAASTVIGWPNFTVGAPVVSPPTSSSLNQPTDVHLDSSGNLWVSDARNYRVLEFPAPLSNGEAATVSLGQTSLTSASDSCEFSVAQSCLSYATYFAFEKSGALWASDSGDCRVVSFNPPFSTGESANTVLGEPDFATGCAGSTTPQNTTASLLSASEGVAIDSSGNVWVSDGASNRVVEYLSSTTGATSTTGGSSSVSTTTGTSSSPTSTATTTAATSSPGGGGGISSSTYLAVAAVVVVVVIVAAVFLFMRRR